MFFDFLRDHQVWMATNPKQWPKYEFFTGILILPEHDFVLIERNKSANIYTKCLNCCLVQIFIWISGSYMNYKKRLKINSEGLGGNCWIYTILLCKICNNRKSPTTSIGRSLMNVMKPFLSSLSKDDTHGKTLADLKESREIFGKDIRDKEVISSPVL